MKETNKIPCPCCGGMLVEDYDICDQCAWENDPVQRWKPNQKGGANIMSLEEAKEAYMRGKSVE